MNQLKGLLYGAFLGDGFALGPHWIYNTDKIKDQFGTVDAIVAPPPSSFHTNKKKGDFTHYGDQSLLVLKSLSEMKAFDLQKLKTDWLAYMASYKGYKDHATTESVKILSATMNYGSISDELGGFSIMAPFIVKYYQDPDLKKNLIATIKLTHNNDLLIEMVNFFTDVLLKILAGNKPAAAIEKVILKTGNDLQDYYQRAAQDLSQDAVLFIKNNGQSCHARDAFPATLFLVLKHENNFRAAMQDNVMAGGDSAARGMVIGMILGAYLGFDALPKDWLGSLNQMSAVDDLYCNLTAF